MNRHALGNSLLGLQFACLLALCALVALEWSDLETPDWVRVCLAVGLLLGLWALSVNRPGNFRLHPLPREGGHFIDHGPYRWIRHPMYSAVLLVSAALAGALDTFPGWMLVLTLMGVLMVKASFEERWMAEQHPGYAQYRARTRGFIPFLY